MIHPNEADSAALLVELHRAGVRFIVVGGAAAQLHGSTLATLDLDIVHQRTPANVAALLDLLHRLDSWADSLRRPRQSSASAFQLPRANATYPKPWSMGIGIVGGRTFSGHALDQMRNRGLMPSVVENTIQTGVRSADPIVGRLRYIDAVNNVTVVTEGERVITAVHGRLGR